MLLSLLIDDAHVLNGKNEGLVNQNIKQLEIIFLMTYTQISKVFIIIKIVAHNEVIRYVKANV